jgi:hypothetical protein
MKEAMMAFEPFDAEKHKMLAALVLSEGYRLDENGQPIFTAASGSTNEANSKSTSKDASIGSQPSD